MSLSGPRRRGTSPPEQSAAVPGLRLLGRRQVRSKPALIQRVRPGLPFAPFVALERSLGLIREGRADLVAIPVRTLARRQREGRLSAEESDRLLRAARVGELALDLFEGDGTECRDWLHKPNPALDAVSPRVFITTEVGARELELWIGRLSHGGFR